MSVSLVAPENGAIDQGITTSLELSYTGDLLPWEYWVDGELKDSYPEGSMWAENVTPTQLGMPGNVWEYSTEYSWYVKYAHTAATKNWVTDHWEFTGLEYTNTSARTFTTEAGGAPSKPTTPSPGNNTTEVDFSGFTLGWVDGGRAETYDVYIGPSGSLVRVSIKQAGTSYVTNINEVPYGEKIYWRVDAFNDAGEAEGTVWNFAAYPGAPKNPTPADDASGITLDDTTLIWEAGTNTDSFDVYFRPYGEFFEKIASDITDLSVDTIVAHTPAFNGHYTYGELYLWVVIAKNQFGLNYSAPVDFGIGYGGTVWQFNAMLFEPPLPFGVTLDYSGDPDDDDYGDPTGDPSGINFMTALRSLVAAANNRIWYEDI